jgi:uncharacterized membrane protein YesL
MDSPIVAVGMKIANLLLLNLYWLIGCAPIVTIGTSTIAAYTVTLKMSENRDESGVTRAFWSAYVHNLKHGIILTVILLISIYSIWIDFQLFNKTAGNPIGFLIVAIFLIVLVLMHYLFVFPLEARYTNSVLHSLQNSRLICMKYFTRVLALIGILFVQFLFFTQINIFLLYIGLFIAPILAIYTSSQIIMPIFRNLEVDSKSSDGYNINDTVL